MLDNIYFHKIFWSHKDPCKNIFDPHKDPRKNIFDPRNPCENKLTQATHLKIMAYVKC